MATKPLYYLTDFSDEVVPCDPSLPGWAAWLAQPDADYGRDAGVADGSTFEAAVLSLGPDLIATMTDGELKLDRDPSPYEFFAVRFGPGLSWSSDDTADEASTLREVLGEYGTGLDNGDIKDVYGEAKATGFDVKTMRAIVRLRRLEKHHRDEADMLLDTYKTALGI